MRLSPLLFLISTLRSYLGWGIPRQFLWFSDWIMQTRGYPRGMLVIFVRQSVYLRGKGDLTLELCREVNFLIPTRPHLYLKSLIHFNTSAQAVSFLYEPKLDVLVFTKCYPWNFGRLQNYQSEKKQGDVLPSPKVPPIRSSNKINAKVHCINSQVERSHFVWI